MAGDRYEDKPHLQQQRREECEKEIEFIETKLARLRVLYDQYFMGVEKLEPMTPRIEIEKTLLRSKVTSLGSTVQRFKFRALQQRFTSYCGYWDRLIRLIEEGRIRRGIVGVATRKDEAGDDYSPEAPLAARRKRFKRDIFRGEEAAGTQVGAAAAEAALAAAPPPEERNEFRPDEVDAIYQKLVRDKTQAGEAVDKLSRDVVSRSLDRVVAKLQGKDVRIKVALKDGAITMVAVLKKPNP